MIVEWVRAQRRGLSTQPYGAPVLSVRMGERWGPKQSGAVSQKVLDPVAEGLGKSEVDELSDQSTWNDGVEGRDEVYEKHPHIDVEASPGVDAEIFQLEAVLKATMQNKLQMVNEF